MLILLLIAFLFLIMRQVFNYVRTLYIAATTKRLIQKQYNCLFDKYIHTNSSYQDSTPVGDLTNVFMTEADRAVGAIMAPTGLIVSIVILSGYLTLAAKLFSEGIHYAEGWNFGPEDMDAKNVEWITSTICKLWGEGASFSIDANPQPHEANYLKLDCSKAKSELDWLPKWNIETTLNTIVNWNKAFLKGENIRTVTEQQIKKYFEK